jgi:hypothetical protein
MRIDLEEPFCTFVFLLTINRELFCSQSHTLSHIVIFEVVQRLLIYFVEEPGEKTKRDYRERRSHDILP